MYDALSKLKVRSHCAH